VEEIINFTGVIQEKKFHILHPLYSMHRSNEAISFVDEDNNISDDKNKENNYIDENINTLKDGDCENYYNNSTI
jgi:hypothetical protein